MHPSLCICLVRQHWQQVIYRVRRGAAVQNAAVTREEAHRLKFLETSEEKDMKARAAPYFQIGHRTQGLVYRNRLPPAGLWRCRRRA
jgi:hypothetical protein